jgi:uncharacterized protein YraI
MNTRSKSKWIYLAIPMALALLGVLLLALPISSAFAAQDGTDGGTGFSADVVTATTTVNLNIRSGPGTEYEILATLPEGSVVGFTGFTDATGEWVQVDAADGPLGWVVARYLSNVPEGLQIRPADLPEPVEAVEEAMPAPMVEEESFSPAVVTAIANFNLNVRSGPGTEYELLATIPAGSVVGFTGFMDGTGEWVQVDAAAGPLGWVAARYLSNVPEGLQVRPADLPEEEMAAPAPPPEVQEEADTFSQAVVTATATANLNVRSGPGTEYDILDTLPQGSVVGFTGFMDSTGNWVQIDAAAGPVGWVAAQYLSNVPGGLQVSEG